MMVLITPPQKKVEPEKMVIFPLTNLLLMNLEMVKKMENDFLLHLKENLGFASLQWEIKLVNEEREEKVKESEGCKDNQNVLILCVIKINLQ
jgi:hypothetical protein